MRVAILDGAEQLPKAFFGLDRVHAVGVAFEVLKDGAFDELEDQVQLALAPEDLDEVDDVVVFKLLRRSAASAVEQSGAEQSGW